MALIFHLENLEKHLGMLISDDTKEYIRSAYRDCCVVSDRLHGLDEGAFEKVMLSDGAYALEQRYRTKLREHCFFESHQKYIDIQCIVDGAEAIELQHINKLVINEPYSHEHDVVKYRPGEASSLLNMQKGMIAVFFPEDGHMPCLQVPKNSYVIKTVLKVPVSVW